MFFQKVFIRNVTNSIVKILRGITFQFGNLFSLELKLGFNLVYLTQNLVMPIMVSSKFKTTQL
jgi:hypothetical protein